jgi:hypothetical protein
VTRALPAAIGLRVKTARATAVLLVGPMKSPRVLARHAVELWDPRVPASRQPYHAGLELPDGENAAIVRTARDAARGIALRAMRELTDEVRRAEHDLRGVGLVVSSDSEPQTLKNPHVRAHAFEGLLFREILEAAAAACGLPCLVLLEKGAYERAAPALHRPVADLRRAVVALGADVAKPWAAEEKMASLAAWVALR